MFVHAVVKMLKTDLEFLNVPKIYCSNVSAFVLFSSVNIWHLFFVLCTGIYLRW